MPAYLISILILLIIFAWFLIGEEKSFIEKITILLIFLGIYAGYMLLNGATLIDIFVEPIKGFYNYK